MKYARPPFPHGLYAKFRERAAKLGWDERGEPWKFLDILLDYADLHPHPFRKR